MSDIFLEKSFWSLLALLGFIAGAGIKFVINMIFIKISNLEKSMDKSSDEFRDRVRNIELQCINVSQSIESLKRHNNNNMQQQVDLLTELLNNKK